MYLPHLIQPGLDGWLEVEVYIWESTYLLLDAHLLSFKSYWKCRLYEILRGCEAFKLTNYGPPTMHWSLKSPWQTNIFMRCKWKYNTMIKPLCFHSKLCPMHHTQGKRNPDLCQRKIRERTWISDKNDPETKGIWKGLCGCKYRNWRKGGGPAFGDELTEFQ